MPKGRESVRVYTKGVFVANEYKQTMNLPKTGFPMRAGLSKSEPKRLKDWQDNKVYEQVLKKNEGHKKFVLHDGPPYANGPIHLGHAQNKISKDIINRYKSMQGFQTPYVPGWDCHGLPIELKAIKQLGVDSGKIDPVTLRKSCREFALSCLDGQKAQFKRLGVWGDFDDPYLTIKPEFEAKQVEVFGKMMQKGYIYKGLKPVYWCYHDETALAEAEIEYQDDPCTTVYVKFPLHDDQGKLTDEEKKNLSFVIWTTTIWTLPGNLAIALNPVESYVIVRNNQNGEQYLVAEALMEKDPAQAERFFGNRMVQGGGAWLEDGLWGSCYAGT